MLDIYKFDESILGAKTSDPLRYAFPQKQSAHAGGMAAPIPPEKKVELLERLYHQHGQKGDKRCLYIHIPFCRVRCTFCNFFQNAASRKLVDEYFAALMVEIEQKAAQPWTQNGIFHAVYIGGGTPTDLSAKQLEQLGKAIRRVFPLSTDCEITLEGRINRFSDEMFERALEGGFNRFSFGIQSFNTQVRRSAKRLDDREQVMERIASLSSTEQAPIIVDLLYGLPYQTEEVFAQDLRDFMATGAHGLDLYQLVVGGNAPMIAMVEKGRIPAPANAATKAAMYKIGSDFMTEHHLTQLSVNHWTRDHRERSQYNSLAKTYAEVLPIGCGAGGNIGGYGLMNHRTLESYMNAIKSGDSTVIMMTKHHPLEPLFAALKSGFDHGVVSRASLPEFNGQPSFDFLRPLFVAWQKRGLVEIEANYLVLTLAGRFWAVSLAQAAIQVLQQSFQQHTAVEAVVSL